VAFVRTGTDVGSDEPAGEGARKAEVNTDERVREELAAGYSPAHRAYELGGIFVAVLVMGWLVTRVASEPAAYRALPIAGLVGLIIADFMSGMIHWACDTWGSTSTPILGQLAIRTFREHHVDEKAIIGHDFVETNGHNYALSVIVSVGGLLADSPWWQACLLSAAVFVALTSQIHKWAHMETAPWLVRVLQKCGVILSPAHHAGHHRAPHTRNYCITVGWLNPVLRAIRFFEAFEATITAVTGIKPRATEEPRP
jgi:ubiquitin-conjugating enzyme E2 variant